MRYKLKATLESILTATSWDGGIIYKYISKSINKSNNFISEYTVTQIVI